MATSIGKGMYGLSGSGMDVDDMVKKMMSAQQARYDKMYKNKTKTEWQKSSYNNFYKTLTTFRFDTLSNYKLQSSMSAKAAKISDETIATVQANGEAVEMTHNLNVKQLATSAYLQSGKITRMDGSGAADPGNTSIYMKDLIGANMPTKPTEPTDPAVPVAPTPPDPATATQAELDKYQADLTKYNADLAAYPAQKNDYDNVLKPKYDAEMVIYNKELDKTAFSFKIGDGKETKVLTYTYRQLAGDKDHDPYTMNDFASSINNLGLNLQATYDNGNDAFSISNKTGGEDNKISIGVSPDLTNPDDIKHTQNIFNNLHLAEYDSATDALKPALQLTTQDPSVSVKGQSAVAVIDGKEYKSNSNKISAAGITYTLNKVGTAKTTVSADTDKVVDNVKKFVEDYNKMIDSLNKSIYQEQYKDFLPLTNEEKSAMSDDEIKRWEEKAKSGLLRNDSILRDLVNGMRSAVSQPVSGSGKYNSAANLGLTTGDYTEHGKLHLDEDVLRKALAEDPDAVYKVFGTLASDTDEKGIASRLGDVAKIAMDKIKVKAGLEDEAEDESIMGSQITSMKEKMAKFQTQMELYQARLYKQFNAMETAIASLNSQASFVSTYMGGN